MKPSNAAEPALTASERLLRHDRRILILSLVGLTGLAWVYLVVVAADMAVGDMRLMGMGRMDPAMLTMLMPMPWDSTTVVLMGLIWWIMMVGMMVPSAAPMILLFAHVQRTNLPLENPALRITLFTGGYLALWLVFSGAATALQWVLGRWDLLLPVMKTQSALLAAGVFVLAGVYQFTPLKNACLARCQAPLTFLSQHWRKGNLGAWQMGLHHGAYCVGCCWGLMLLLFVGGVMNLLWIAAIAAWVLIEKLLLPGRIYTALSGSALLVGAALVYLSQPPSGT
ncbi:MAG: DUF2182 domain-containing protein [Pseudomonadota bacterium]